MAMNTSAKFVCFVLLQMCLLISASVGGIIQGRFEYFVSFKCNNSEVCATSNPSKTFVARSKGQCTFECQHQRESCVGVNYKDIGHTCDIFSSNPTNFANTVAGCQYMQIEDKNNRLPDCLDFDLQPLTLVAALPGSGVLATALLNSQLFVTRSGVAQVSVYDTTSFQQIHSITWSGLSHYLYGLATSSANNYLYIGADTNNVHRVDLATLSVTTWNVPNVPLALSLNSAGNIIIATSGNEIREYTPDGLLVRETSDSNSLWQAVEVNNGVWVYSRLGPVNGIAMRSMNGTVIKSFGSASGPGITQMDSPRGIVVDRNGYFVIADCNNNRVLVMDPSLTVARQLTLPVSAALWHPISLNLDQPRGRLYIGEDGSQGRVLVFEGIL